MGEPKQLLKWGNSNLLGHTITQAQQVCKDVFVVLGAHFDAIAPTIAGAQIIYNKDWELGMGSSVATGLRHVGNKGTFTHVLIMLADQPYLDAAYLKELLIAISKKPFGIIATQYEDKVGVPAIFSATYFKELEQLNEDYGARKLLKNHEDAIFSITPKVSTVDIDTQVTYLRQKPK